MKVLKSPVFIICALLFTIHQVMQKVLDIQYPLIDRYLDNLLAMPIILTLLRIERRYLLGRKYENQLSIAEIAIATILIILVAELLFPLYSRDFTTDWRDVLFYGAGSLIFHFSINQRPV
jgi:hypothetical protein